MKKSSIALGPQMNMMLQSQILITKIENRPFIEKDKFTLIICHLATGPDS